MSEWKRIFEIDELKDKLVESKNEVLDNVASDMLLKMNTAKNKKEENQEQDPTEKEEEDQLKSDHFYYSVEEKAYKIFNPETKKWVLQESKPTFEQIMDIEAKIKEMEPKIEEKGKVVVQEDI